MGMLAALVGIGLGALGVLAGLVMIAPEVRVHQIRVYGAGSWVFRAGALLALIGVILARTSGAPAPLNQVGALAGGAALLGGLFVLNHERAQALHGGADRWDWLRSLTLQMFAAGAILLAAALVPA